MTLDRIARFRALEAEFWRHRPNHGTKAYYRYVDRLEDIWCSMTPREQKQL